MSDIGLFLINNCIDLKLENGDLASDSGLETAVLLSLFSDQRAGETELPPGHLNKRGWWGDLFPETTGDRIGSKLWTISRDKASPETSAIAEVRAKQALQWLIDDGVASSVNISAEFDSDKVLRMNITIIRPDQSEDVFGFFWDGQEVKRA